MLHNEFHDDTALLTTLMENHHREFRAFSSSAKLDEPISKLILTSYPQYLNNILKSYISGLRWAKSALGLELAGVLMAHFCPRYLSRVPHMAIGTISITRDG